MADFDNLSEISENFDTIKTLLNSIRAQGILNTSDVDKLLSGINTKLEKINTEEDIDLIKIFLSELKQTLDERHGVLVSKFGAIESLFSNLLKNSSEMLKSSEVKELFDIVATNLSVFSREVVSQKESLTDITLRIDALRSDDSDKKDIIKNIALLKPDLERLNNGFDSIVLSLNDNFKAIIKTITTIDKTEHLDKFADSLSSIDMSVNTVLSALQMLDKKSSQIDETLHNIATKEDLGSTNKRIVELSAQAMELTSAVGNLNDSYSRLDNLSDKINASVNIIASLKSVLEDTDDNNTKLILEKLNGLSVEVQTVKDEAKFEEFRTTLQEIVRSISGITNILDKSIITSFEDVLNNALNTNTQKVFSLQDANINKVLNEISTSSDSFVSRINDAKTSISGLCERNFASVVESVTNLKNVVAQIDENSISANNAIFSSITDRLSLFETTLRDSLDLQEKTVSHSSNQLVEHIESIKNLSNILDYKMDSSVVETANIRKDFGSLQDSVEKVLALDFVNVVKDLRVDLYASKQEVVNALEQSSSELSEKFTTDLYSKYQLVISKLDVLEDDLKKVQIDSLSSISGALENISSSIMDVLSYVSETNTLDVASIENKIDDLTDVVKENKLDYVESVRDIVELLKAQIDRNLKELVTETTNGFENVKEAVKDSVLNIKSDIYSLEENVDTKFGLVNKSITEATSELTSSLDSIEKNIHSNLADTQNLISSTTTELKNNVADFEKDVDIRFISTNETIAKSTEDLKNDLKHSYSKLLEIKDSYEDLKTLLNETHEDSSLKITSAISTSESLRVDFESKIANLKAQIFDKITEFKQEFTCENADKVTELKFSVENMYTKNSAEIVSFLQDLRTLINNLQNDSSADRNDISEKINEGLISLKDYMGLLSETASNELTDKVNSIIEDFATVKTTINSLDENIDSDLTRQLSIVESNFEALVSQITILFEKSDRTLSDKINNEFEQIAENVQNILAERLESYKAKIETSFDTLNNKAESQANYIRENVENLNKALKLAVEEQAEENLAKLDEITKNLKAILDDNIKQTAVDYVALKEKLSEFVKNTDAHNQSLIQTFRAQMDDIAKYVDSVLDLQTQEYTAKQQEVIEKLGTTSTAVLEKVDGVADITSSTKIDIEALAQAVGANKAQLLELEASLSSAVDTLKQSSVELSAEGKAALDTSFTEVLEQINLSKQNIKACSDSILEFLNKELKTVNSSIEKETDTIIAELIEQFEILKKSQADDIINLSSRIEEIVSNQIYTNIEDLKEYLDVKTDYTVLESKLDNLKIDLSTSVENVVSGMNKMLEAGTFDAAMADFKLANELLLNNAVDNLNDKIDAFVSDNLSVISDGLANGSKSVEEKLALFDKKFVETVVDKYEEIKLMVNNYNSSFETIESHFNKIISDFEIAKISTNEKLDILSQGIQDLTSSFEGLKDQISNKSFDEAFQTSINKQIGDLETLIRDQIGYLEDINSLCETNLPDVTEMNILLKGSLFEAIKGFSEKLDSVNLENSLESELKQFKSDIITQFINVFNQVSFVAEQEEILDYIQEKHDELITILSHIVTTTEDVENIKADIAMINEKINSIISSDGNIDYIYSLQDLESDIANLRLALGEMNSDEFSNLVQSTNDIYALVETIKSELPTKNDFNSMAEDIVSISTRTNKLILATDESYKTLQDNLQEFKLVINDLDERTRNFSQEAGLDRIDSKLNALNNMMQNGAKTNQVFNQVFEYLAEWVDNASTQINMISGKVDSLDELGQIKNMLVDMKSGNDENETEELVEAIESVFNKQTKKISTIEKKLDTVIVETTMNKVDLSPIEKTLNRFILAMEDKMAMQQDKINQLEAKLENAISLLDGKETAQLTKKVGGMDKQIAKLNKSIEKIASHVVEK